MTGNTLTSVAMFGFIPFVALVFLACRDKRHAVVFSFVVGWLFLPSTAFPIPGWPDYTKATAVGISVLLGISLFDFNRLVKFRPSIYDIPVVLLVLCGAISARANGDSLYTAGSEIVGASVLWLIPYFVGRLYFNDFEGMKVLGRGIVYGGLAYVPFLLFEIRMSPRLSEYVYGFGGRANFLENYGALGWKPLVFMNTSFETTMFMAISTLICVSFMLTRAQKHIFGFPMWCYVGGFFVMTIACKVWSGIILMMGGLSLMLFIRYFPWRIALLAFVMVVPCYVATRVSGLWNGMSAVELVSKVSTRRSESLLTRMENENLLIERAKMKPAFGWGGYGRSRIRNERGEDITRTDGLWIIIFGKNGFLGLMGFIGVLLLPLGLFMLRYKPKMWRDPVMAGAIPMFLMVGLFAIDSIVNAILNPFYVLAVGGLVMLRPVRRRVPRSAEVVMAERQMDARRRRNIQIRDAADRTAHA